MILVSATLAQVVITPNLTSDGEDFNLADGLCDTDAVTPGLQCTLRAALQNAAVIGGAVTIQLGAATYQLTIGGTDDIGRWGDLDVHGSVLSSLLIAGVPGLTAIDAAPLAVIGTPDRVLHITSSVAATLAVEVRNVRLQGGRLGGSFGGGIWHQRGKLLLTGCDIFDNQASDGGGLRIDAEFAMSGGSIQSCVASGISTGGGAFVQWSGTPIASFSGVTFAGNNANKGGGLRIPAGIAVDVVNSTFTSNTAGNSGGAIDLNGTCTVAGSAFQSNNANSGGAISVASNGMLTAGSTTLRSNTAQFGGGINLAGLGNGTLTDCSVDANSASLNGGGIANSGTLTLMRTTVSRNRAQGTSGGGGVYSLGMLTADLCTISKNDALNGSGGGFFMTGSAPKEISCCTIAQNHAANAGGGVFADITLGPSLEAVVGTLLDDNTIGPGLRQNFGGTPLMGSFGLNLDSDGTCMFAGPGDLSGTTSLPFSGQLGPLQNNGGATETHALMHCSPAIDRGSCNTFAGIALPMDQRSFPRVGPCDIGAFEYQLPFVQFTAYCFGTPATCPCGIGGAPGHGCPSSASNAGATISATGIASVSYPSVTLAGSGMTNSPCMYIQGTAQAAGGAGTPFGDGLLCVTGAIIRLGIVTNVGGASAWPPAPSSWGLVGLTPGGLRMYQTWYRDALVHCTPATFNLSSALQILWCP
ncbi:MAG: hypothetical protein JNL28_00590 [Planctomycetes bacterium]|nr:hypothetical protein [Planctomycetota bacterium]